MSEPRTLGIVMDPIEAIQVHKDTSLALLLAAQKRGWQLFYMTQQDLFLDQGLAKATSASLRVTDDTDNSDDACLGVYMY